MMVRWYDVAHLRLAPFIVPAVLWGWLTDAGSLVARLRRHGMKQPHILWMQQSWQFPQRDECQRLGLPLRRYALIREVLIGEDHQPCVFARTVFPPLTLTGAERALARLGGRTLGSVLFKSPHLKRSAFEMAYLSAGWQQKIRPLVKGSLTPLWARRSTLILKDKPMLVMEVFLPGSRWWGENE